MPNKLLLRKTKTYNVTPAKAGVQSEKTGFPLPREWQILLPQQELTRKITKACQKQNG